ncbi:MAG: 3'-5' exonuclease, partial [Bacteroidota bacterium]
QMGLGASLNNFIVYLNSLESQEQKPEKVKGSVNVLTYHGAKGLEWNVVVLESLEKDELKENEVMKKSFFGVNDIVTEMPSAENLFPERYIQLLPWFMGANDKLPEDLKKYIQEKPEYKLIEGKIREELKRLLYVGVTRARDFLVTISYKKNSLKWIENAGGKEVRPDLNTGNKIDIWDTGKYSEFEIITGDPDFEGIQDEEQPKKLTRPLEHKSFEERYISPSKISEDSTFDVDMLKDFRKRISLKDGQNTDDADIGNCLHYIYYSYNREEDDAHAKTESILKTLNMWSVFTNPKEIVNSVENLYQFLENRYGTAARIYKELPLQNLTDGGQVIRGSIDLVWETQNGVVVVDYKSYQGGINKITDQKDDHYAGIYGPQLLTYQKMLEAAGKKVLATCIYYAVMGVVVVVKSK